MAVSVGGSYRLTRFQQCCLIYNLEILKFVFTNISIKDLLIQSSFRCRRKNFTAVAAEFEAYENVSKRFLFLIGGDYKFVGGV